jgi:hypothetical protein
VKTDSEVSEFWGEIEKEHNAKVVFRTFAILLGKSSEVFQDLRGLLYIVGDKIVFEDFEKTDRFLEFLVRKKKEKKYEKFKISFSIDEIINIKEVSNQTARRCIDGSLRHSETKTVRSRHRFFSRSICQIQLIADYSLFFDLLDLSGFIASCKSLGYTTG